MANGHQNGNGENGMTYATLLVALSFTVVLILVIAFFLWFIRYKDNETFSILHKKEEEAAYRFSWVNKQLTEMQRRCNEKKQKIDMWMKWNELHPVKENPPLELLTNGNDCIVSEEMPKFPTE